MSYIRSNRASFGIASAVVLVGVAARAAMATRGFNFDVESYRIVADIMAAGGNVYQQTSRYNYGPIWFLILGFLDWLPFNAGTPLISLRWKVIALLTLVDMAIAWLMLRRFGMVPATLFFLNPISIVVTGYNNQFDNLAVLLGLMAIVKLEGAAPLTRNWWLGLFLLGASLSTKHLLFVMPLWLAFRQSRWRDKLFVLTIPTIFFLAAFLPYLKNGSSGILANVFLYRSIANAPFWWGVMPPVLFRSISPMLPFVLALTVLGLLCRRRSLTEAFMLYLVGLVVFAPAIANQYLAICSASIALAPNATYLLYTLGSLAYMAAGDPRFEAWVKPAFGAGGAKTGIGYQRLLALLALGLAWQLMSPATRAAVRCRIAAVGSRLMDELRLQTRAPW